MGLDKTTLKSTIISLLQDLQNYDGSSGKTSEAAVSKFANDLADAIDTFVKTGEVTVKIAVADTSLQTSTALGNPTGPPAAQKTLTEKGTIS